MQEMCEEPLVGFRCRVGLMKMEERLEAGLVHKSSR
jgi:hypothetical protein